MCIQYIWMYIYVRDCTYIPAFLRAAVPNTRPPAVARRPGPKAAHTADNVVTAAVFHAPMFALNADAQANACAPKPPAVDADGKALASLRRGSVGAQSHTRARTRTHTWGACARPYLPLTAVYTFVSV